jgi:hypothetical protein
MISNARRSVIRILGHVAENGITVQLPVYVPVYIRYVSFVHMCPCKYAKLVVLILCTWPKTEARKQHV